MPNNPNNIELRSDEVKDIIGTVPARIIRYGILSVFSVVALLIVGSFFFSYPDLITTRMTLTGQNPPADIKARLNGKISELFVSDKEAVEQGTVLAVLESAIEYKDYLYLKNEIEKSKNGFLSINSHKKLQLGEIQSVYTTFIGRLTEYQDFVELDYHSKKIKALQKQHTAYAQSLQTAKRQSLLTKQDFELTKKQYYRDSVLFARRVTSELEREQAESKLLRKKMDLENAHNNITNLKIRIFELEQQIADLELSRDENIKKIQNSASEAFENLKAQMKLWEYNYLFVSPISGIVSFTDVWSENQNTEAGQTVFTVVPKGKGSIKGHALLPLSGAGKVEAGQKVNVKFDNFPDVEYGMVRARVESVSLVHNQKFYTVRISFPDSLTTSYGKELPFIQNMQASAEIITEDLPLFARFFNPLKSILKKDLKTSGQPASKTFTTQGTKFTKKKIFEDSAQLQKVGHIIRILSNRAVRFFNMISTHLII